MNINTRVVGGIVRDDDIVVTDNSVTPPLTDSYLLPTKTMPSSCDGLVCRIFASNGRKGERTKRNFVF